MKPGISGSVVGESVPSSAMGRTEIWESIHRRLHKTHPVSEEDASVGNTYEKR